LAQLRFADGLLQLCLSLEIVNFNWNPNHPDKKYANPDKNQILTQERFPSH
jgi:hypothetical protein